MEEQNIYLPIALGIFSSLVATAIFIGFSELTRRLVIPWFEDKVYRGVRIDGEWEIHTIDGSPYGKTDMKLEISQWGDKISGIYFHDDGDEKTSYNVTGILKNMYFMGYMDPHSNKMVDACAILMHVEHQDSHLILKGSVLYKSDNEVASWDTLVFRQKSS